MGKENLANHSLLICVFLSAAIIAIYWPVYKHEFIEYDDNIYITNNINIQSGFTPRSVFWALTTDYFNWHPVTWLSHILDYQLFKGRAGGHHITNVLFHILNTLILFYILKQMTRAVWPSAFVAAAFAIHPLHVEPVAWIAARKDVLSTFFWLLTMWAYYGYVKNLKIKWYIATIALFLLGLMTKSMLVTIPFVFLLLDYWPLERKISARLFIEKIPFFILTTASCVLTYIVQQKVGAVSGIETLGLTDRINNAIVSYVMYIIKMVWPSKLAVLYPLSSVESMGKVFACGLSLLLISVFCIYTGRRHKYLAFGWLWFIGTLVPVIGLVQIGAQAMADRYSYITLTGLFIIIAWSAKEFVPKRMHKLLAAAAVVILFSYGIAAARQVRYWQNSQTLFERTMQVTKHNYIIQTNYIIYLSKTGQIDKVIEQSYDLLKNKPDSVQTRNSLGIALAMNGKIQKAAEQFSLAIKSEPNYALSYFNLGLTLQNSGKLEGAVYYYKKALKIQPIYPEACANLGDIFAQMGKYEQAIEYYKKALAIEPENEKIKEYIKEAQYRLRMNEPNGKNDE